MDKPNMVIPSFQSFKSDFIFACPEEDKNSGRDMFLSQHFAGIFLKENLFSSFDTNLSRMTSKRR